MIIKSHEIPKIVRGHWSTRGLVGYWPMMPYEVGGNKVFDLSGNGYGGVFGGNVAWTMGKFGSALDFPGDAGDSIEPGVAVFDCSKPFSVSCWINPDAAGTQDAIWAKYTGGTEGILLRRDADTTLDIWLSAVVIQLTLTVNNGTWYHTFVTYDGTKTYVYVNAILDPATPVTKTLVEDAPIMLFQIGESSLNHYEGQLDIPMVWQRYFTASEVAELYLNPLLPIEREPIELWVGATSVGVAPPTGMAGAMTTNTGYWGY